MQSDGEEIVLPALTLASYVGAEGEGQGEAGTGDAGAGESGGTGTPLPTASSTDPKTYNEDYVKSLRSENAKYRTEAKSVREELDKLTKAEEERKKAKMDDLERAQTELETVTGRATKAESTLKRAQTELQVVIAAGKLNFTDPADAMAMLDPSNLEFDDDGRPDAKSIERQLTDIAKAKPYLLKEGTPAPTGSGDGGPKPPAAPTDAFQAKVSEHQKTFENQGFIPIPQ